jgi:hypothetical protein
MTLRAHDKAGPNFVPPPCIFKKSPSFDRQSANGIALHTILALVSKRINETISAVLASFRMSRKLLTDTARSLQGSPSCKPNHVRNNTFVSHVFADTLGVNMNRLNLNFIK